MTAHFSVLQGAIFAIACLVWGFNLAHLGAVADSRWLNGSALFGSVAFIFIYLYHTKVTELTRLRLQDKNEELEAVRQAVNDHCLVTMVDANRKTTFVNDSYLSTTGYSCDEVLGQDPVFFEYDPDDQRPAEIECAMTAARKWVGDIKIKRKDGSVLWTNTTITPRYNRTGDYEGSISVRTDVTATKVAVAEREAISILHKMNDNVFIFEPETYQFTYMNEAGMQRLNWDRDTYIQKTVLDSDRKFDRTRFDAFVAPLLEGATDQVQVTVNLDDGPFEISVQLIEQENGKESFVAVFRNIADQIEVDRIKDEFISTVSHELRSPITSIKGALGLLAASCKSDVPLQVKKLLDIAQRNADRLVVIVNDILDLEKIAAGSMKFEFEQLAVCDVVNEAIQINKGIEEQYDVHIRFEGSNLDALVNVDLNRMTQVLTNLLSNAAKFSHEGDSILVSIDQDDDLVRIIVQDFGVGISDSQIDGIFDRFAQADNHSERSGKGTGLGLSIVKAIVETHCGKISVASKLGQGSTFTIRLPITHSKALENDQFAKAS